MGFRFWEHSGPTEAHGRSDNRKSTGHIDDSPEHQEIKEEEDFLNKNDPEKSIYNTERSYDPTAEMDDKIDRELTGNQTIEDLEEQEAKRDEEFGKNNTSNEETPEDDGEDPEDQYSEFLVTGPYSNQYAEHPGPIVTENAYFDKLAEEKLGDLDTTSTSNLNEKVKINKKVYGLYENPQEKHHYQERGHRKGKTPIKPERKKLSNLPINDFTDSDND